MAMPRTRTHALPALLLLLAAVPLGAADQPLSATAPALVPAAAVSSTTATVNAASTTASGVPLPAGWGLLQADRFGTAGNVGTCAQLHAKYREGQYYNVDANGLVKIPNVVINHEQGAYVHFEQGIVFAADHLTIQGRGHPDGTITTAELVSTRTARSWCVEARYRLPATDKSWPAFWNYAAGLPHDSSEFDIEQPLTANLGVHDVTFFNHPGAKELTVADPRFSAKGMVWHDDTFSAASEPHTYAILYDDATHTVERHLDGKLIYRAAFTWNASLGGTGHGADACTIINLAVGGSWPGQVADPPSYSADLDLYSLDYYGPVAAR